MINARERPVLRRPVSAAGCGSAGVSFTGDFVIADRTFTPVERRPVDESTGKTLDSRTSLRQLVSETGSDAANADVAAACGAGAGAAAAMGALTG